MKNKKINVLFDATWIAKYHYAKTMHGGLRVAVELTKRLANSESCNAFYMNTSFEKGENRQLSNYVQNELMLSKDFVVSNHSNWLTINDYLSKIPKTTRLIEAIKQRHPFPLKKSQLDRFTVYHSPVDPIPDIIKEHKKIKPFLTALDLIPLIRPEYAYSGFGEYLKKVYDSIDQNTIVLAISESTKNDLLNYRKDLKEENVVVSYIAADKNIFYANKEANNKDAILKKHQIKYSKYFFTLNALAKYKNIEHVIQSFLQYIKANNENDTGLVIIGHNRESDFRQSLEFKYRQFSQIQFIEYVPDEDLSVIYSNARAFLYMSLYEGFGLPILEAMQCGVPVICSNTSSMPEVIGDCGICINPLDIDLLSQSIAKMDHDDDYRKQCIELGLERSKLFSWDKYASDIVSAYSRYTE